MRLYPGFNFDLFQDQDSFSDRNTLKTDIIEKDGFYILKMEVAGFKKENIQLELKEGTITITATKEKDNNVKVIRQERFVGRCSRSFYVGENIRQEDIKASFNNGELEITIPTEAKKRKGESSFIQIF
ncbi:Hsp20/alpha crystallin family protein [Floccifex sp.]|uniref:Hsp20/alpha crystallin family protein n=1 Tax=Floccifex sp. TaxID=2815810 RepID=UPI003F0589EF